VKDIAKRVAEVAETAREVDFTLPPEEKEAWCQALESGEYKRAKGELCAISRGYPGEPDADVVKVRGYCCLGVFADVAGLYDLPPEKLREVLGVDEFTKVHTVRFDDSFLPEAVMPFAVQQLFSAMNDDFNYSFKKIAAVIRQAL
jgi:hypothetical protein